MNKIIMFIALIGISSLFVVNADEIPSESSIRELLELTQAESQTQLTLEEINSMIENSNPIDKPDSKINSAQKKIMEDYKNECVKLLNEVISFKNMEKDYINIYKTTFTQSEINGMISYYKTAVGKSEIEKMPMVNRRGMQIVQSKVMALSPKLQQLENEAIEKVKKARSPNAG